MMKTDDSNRQSFNKNLNKTLPPIEKKPSLSDESDLKDIDTSKIKLSSMKDREKIEGYEEFKEKVEQVKDEKPEVQEDSDDLFFSHKVEKFKKYDTVHVKKRKIIARISIGVIACTVLVYASAFVSYKHSKDEIINKIESGINSLTGENKIIATSLSDGLMSFEEKSEYNLVPYLLDNDCDGLSDSYEINESKTDPLLSDSDNDGISDGAEIYFGLDPLKDNGDKLTEVSKTIENKDAELTIKGNPDIYGTYFETTENISLNGAIGLISNAYEFNTNAKNAEVKLSFSYNDNMLNKWDSDKSTLSILRFDNDSNKFVPVKSTINSSKRIVSANISENGIYALGDISANAAEYKTQVFFLIDNSGSMFSEELCENSEENDVDFKRVDFVVNMLDHFDENTLFGSGKFTSDYTTLSEISDDKEQIKKVVEDLKTYQENFTGTEIAESIIRCSKEFNTGKEYKNFIIVLTDGMPSKINHKNEQRVRDLCVENNITVITIGLGKTLDTSYLSSIADDTNGMYFNATNAEALENIYNKIQSFTTYNHVEVSEEIKDTDNTDTVKSAVIADSGFNIESNAIKYNNFRSSNSLGGTSFGISQFVSKYYSGNLETNKESFVTQSGYTVPGYDLSDSTLMEDERTNLADWHCPVLDAYAMQTARSDNRDYFSIKDGHLMYTAKARTMIIQNQLGISTIDYEFKIEDDSSIESLFRKITFNDIARIETADCIYISPEIYAGPDANVIKAISYYQNMYLDNNLKFHDFGYEGDDAFKALTKELSEGRPAILTIGNKTVVGIRLLKSEESANQYKIEVYDCDFPGKLKYITITAFNIFDENDNVEKQYVASYNGENQQLCIYE